MSNFRAIILGAGPVGLIAGHALAKAGIDFVILEKQQDIVRFRGALILLWPPFLRLIDQLGLYEQVTKHATRVTTKTNYTHKGELLCSGDVFIPLEKSFGYPSVGLSRANFLRILYETLPGRETRVRANANAVNIETKEDGVRVHLADGGVVDGSVVIAADGVHSPTRELIQRLERDSSASSESRLKSPMVTTYISIFGHTSCDRDDIPIARFMESHGPGVASQSARLNDSIYFTALKRLETRTSERKSYTKQDLEEIVKELSDMHIFPNIKLKELWPLHEPANTVLVQQEEGVTEKWHHDRVVLVGDAAVKMTSVNGQGAMTGVFGVVSLVNNLRATLQRNARPSTADIRSAFSQYESERREVATEVLNQGVIITRLISWSSDEMEAMDRKMSAEVDMAEDAKMRLLPIFAKCPILNFVPFKSRQGTEPWEKNCEAQIRAKL